MTDSKCEDFPMGTSAKTLAMLPVVALGRTWLHGEGRSLSRRLFVIQAKRREAIAHKPAALHADVTLHRNLFFQETVGSHEPVLRLSGCRLSEDDRLDLDVFSIASSGQLIM